MNVENRLRNERHAIKALIDIADAGGWNLVGVHDGEEFHKTSRELTVLDHVFSVDESWIQFHRDDWTVSVFIVLGNSGAEVVADYSAPTSQHLVKFESEVMDDFNEWNDAHADHFYESEV